MKNQPAPEIQCLGHMSSISAGAVDEGDLLVMSRV